MAEFQQSCPTCNEGFTNRSQKSRHFIKYPSHKLDTTSGTRKLIQQVASDSDSDDAEDANVNFDVSAFSEVEQPQPANVSQPAKVSQPVKIPQPVSTHESQPIFKQSTSDSNKAKGRRITLDVTCEQFMQIGFIMCGSSSMSHNLAELVSALSDKCVERKLDQVYVKSSIDILQLLREFHSSNFRLEKSDLNQQFAFNGMTENQKRTINDLAQLQFTPEAVDKELRFAEYYHKYVKLMSVYKYGSNDRSLSVINAVIDALTKLKFDDYGRIHPMRDAGRKQAVMMLLIGVCSGVLLSIIVYAVCCNVR